MLSRALVCTLSVVLWVPSLRGATQNGVITGSVYDQRGAVVPGATVRLLNATTGFSRSQGTDANGVFTFSSVPPASGYLLSVEVSGFETAFRPDLEVNVGDEQLILPPIQLKPLAQAPPAPKPPTAQPTVPTPQPTPPAPQPTVPAPQPTTPTPQPPEVTKAVPPAVPVAGKVAMPTVKLDLLSTKLGGVIDSNALRTLALKNRDFLDLALLLPGTYPVEQGSSLQGASLVVNGIRADMNNFLLDGVDNNDYTINQSLPFQIVEALQEFRVQSSTSPAEYGRSGGAQINSVSRSGSNKLHGTLFEFLRNSNLGQDNYFSAYSGGGFDRFRRELQLVGVDALNNPALASLYDRFDPQLVENQFGANVGGGLRKDKLFGFFNWESSRISNPRPLFEGVPELSLRSANVCPSCNPTSLNLFDLYPAPNVPLATVQPPGFSSPFTVSDPSFGPAFFLGESGNFTHTDNFLERLDWRKSDRASMSFKHDIQRIAQVQGGTVPQTASYPGNGTDVNGRNQSFSYNYVQQFTPRITNELRLGWNRFRLDTLAQDRSVDPSTVGFQNVNFHDRGLPSVLVGSDFSIGGILFGGFTPLAGLGAGPTSPSRRADSVWSATDSLSYTRGKHILKFGAEGRYIRLNVTNEALGRGIVDFSTPLTPAVGYSDVAYIARVSPVFGGGFDRDFRTKSFDWFFQDQWRAAANFTLNFGVRYELNTAPVEARDRLVNYYPALGGLVRSGSTTVYDDFGGVIGTASHPAPRAGFQTDANNYGPRVGFAWNPWGNNKTVIRGGYAIMFDQQPFQPSVNMLLNPPFVMDDFSLFSTLQDTFSADCLAVPTGPSACSPFSITARDPNTRTPYVHQFNFGIQRQLGNKALFEVAYIGSAGRKLPRLRDFSPCSSFTFLESTQGVGSSQTTGWERCFTDPKLFSSILYQENSANSSFNSLLVRFSTRGYRGIQFQGYYQYAKSIDNASSMQPRVFCCSPSNASLVSSIAVPLLGMYGFTPYEFAGVQSVSPTLSLRPALPTITTQPQLPQDTTNLSLEKGRSDFDMRSRAVINFIYDVPEWKGAGPLGRGWQLAGIASLQSGQPFTVYEDFFGMPLRPNVLRPPQINDSSPDGAIDNATPLGFAGNPNNHSAFGINNNGVVLLPGNLGRNTFTGPRLYDLDASVLKNTYLGREGRTSLQFRMEIFNVFNNTNFFQPYSRGGVAYNDPFNPSQSTTYFDPFYGRILQAGPPTGVQFALKFIF
jgi:hypothetical protein